MNPDASTENHDPAIAQLQTLKRIDLDSLKQLLVASNGLLDTLDNVDLTALPEVTQGEIREKSFDLTAALANLIAQLS